MTENPFGTFTINSVRMPDYIHEQDPITFKVYSDNLLSNLVVDDPKGISIKASDMTPGLFLAE